MIKILIYFVFVAFWVTPSVAQNLTTEQRQAFNAVLRQHAARPDCPKGGEEQEFAQFHQMGELDALVLATCETDSWQMNYMAYIVSFFEGEHHIRQLAFAKTDGRNWTAKIRIHRPEWDEDKKVLKTTDNDDPAGSCGGVYTYEWGEDSFVLTSARHQQCSGKETHGEEPADVNTWPMVYEAGKK